MSFKEMRKKAGLSQREAGARLGVSDAAVCLWERKENGTLPRTSMLSDIAKLYGCTVDDLLKEEGEMEVNGLT